MYAAVAAIDNGDAVRARSLLLSALGVRYVCDECGARLKFPGLLDEHRRRSHPGA